MKIDCELDQDERDALSFILGLGTGMAYETSGAQMAKMGVRIMNKLFADSPDFTPYDENSFDPSSRGFPFKPQPEQ